MVSPLKPAPTCYPAGWIKSLSEAEPGRFGRQSSVTDIYHAMPYHTYASDGKLQGLRNPGVYRRMCTIPYHRTQYHANHKDKNKPRVHPRGRRTNNNKKHTKNLPSVLAIVGLRSVQNTNPPGRRESISRPTSFRSVQEISQGLLYVFSCIPHEELCVCVFFVV